MTPEQIIIDTLIRLGGKYVIWNKNYIIMQDGQIYSIRRDIFLTPAIWKGYPTLTVKPKNRKVANIVADHFVKKSDGCNVVNHLDGNKMNSYYLNLEWTTQNGNAIHAHKSGLMKYPIKNRKDLSKPVAQYDNQLKKIASFPSANEASRITGASARWISACANGGCIRLSGGVSKIINCKTAGGFIWIWESVKRRNK